jgi:hypothetical protein
LRSLFQPKGIIVGMRLRPGAVLLLVLLLAAGGCARAKQKAAEEALRKAGVEGKVQILDASSRPRYEPPEGGGLAAAQVERYVAIQEKYVRRLRAGTEAASASDPSLDERVAREEGLDPEEYLWIRGRVLDALLARRNERMGSSLSEFLRRDKADLERSLSGAKDPKTRALLEEQIRTIDGELAKASEREKPVADAALAANLHLVEPHVAKLEQLQAEVRRLRPLGAAKPSLPSSGDPPAAASSAR